MVSYAELLRSCPDLLRSSVSNFAARRSQIVQQSNSFGSIVGSKEALFKIRFYLCKIKLPTKSWLESGRPGIPSIPHG